jgi:hypothetical protein
MSLSNRLGLGGSRYDPATRILFVVGGGIGIAVSYYFSVRGFGTQIPDMMWAARGIVVFFIALQVYANRNLAATKKNWALMLSALASYGYGIWTNIVGILAFSGLSIRDVSWDNWYVMIIPIMVGLPIEIAPEALIIMGFSPESHTVISDGVAGMWNVVKSIFGSSESRTTYTPQYRTADTRPTVNDLTDPSRAPTPSSPLYRAPASPISSNRSALNSLPRNPNAQRYHGLGNFGGSSSEDDD